MRKLTYLFFAFVFGQIMATFAQSRPNNTAATVTTFEQLTAPVTTLTQAEINYLSQHNNIKVCVDPNWMPFEAIANNKHVGMSAEYLAIISKKLAVNFQLVPAKTWTESLNNAKSRVCDIFSLAMATPERETYMAFTEPYIVVPLVIATTKDKPFIAALPDVLNHRIGLVKGYAFNEFLRQEYPNIDVMEFDNVYQGLAALEKNQIYGFVDNLSVVSYEIGKSFSASLKISGRINRNWELGIAVRNDDPMLFSILTKAVNSIDRNTVHNIQTKWAAVTYEHQFNYSLLWKILTIIAVIIFLFVYRLVKINKFNQTLRQLNNKLKESEESFRHLVNLAYEGICVIQNQRLVFVNPRACEMSGYDEQALLSEASFLSFIAPNERETTLTHYNNRLAGIPSPIRYESKMIKRDGSIYPVEITGVLISWNNSPATMNFISDITERKQAEASIRHMAMHDPLTHLPNRFLLKERLEHALTVAKRTKQPLGLLFMDLNGFKQVNDTYGHDIGDRLLKAVTERILKLMRESDTLARIGGDEFVMLLPQVDGRMGIQTLITRINQSFEAPFKLGEIDVNSSISIGFSLFPEHGDTAEALLHVSDQDMYKVKHADMR